MRKRLLRQLRDERGIALIAALGIMVVLSMTTVTMVVYSSSNERHASLSEAQQLALALAEAGINNAQSILGHGDTLALESTSLTPPGGNTCPAPDSSPCFRQDYDGGYTLWRGQFTDDPNVDYWTLHSWGIVRNPTVGGADIVRYLRAKVDIVPRPDQNYNATAWNYVIAWGTSNATTCDVTLSQTSHIDAPFYVEGNLCMRESSKVYQPDDTKPVSLVVKGKLEVASGPGAGSRVGLSSNQADWIDKAEIVGGCTSNILTATHPCSPSSPYQDHVWANTLSSSSSTTVTRPAADFTGYYQTANPGPMHSCNPGSGATPVFDNDGILDFANAPNGSVGTVDLTPTGSYSCIGRDAGGYEVGKIVWDAPTKTLTLSGAIYIDGSVLIDDNTLIKYSGHASLYLSGTFRMTNGQTRLCAAWSGNDCDFATWNPNQNMLIIVAHGDDGSGNSIQFQQGVQFQGGLFAENAIDLGESSRSEGPMIGRTVKVGQSVQIKPLPLIETLPLGAPGIPNTHATPQKPSFTG